MSPLSDPGIVGAAAAPQGAYTELAELIGLRLGARELDLGRQRKAFSLLVGPHQSKFRGRGIEFEEVRAYQAGDDIRSIDWRVTARSGKPHTKLFREERERPVILLVDQSLSMFFGSRTCCKSVTAAHVAALLAWAAFQHNDRVGGLVCNGHDQGEVRPRRSAANVLHLIRGIDDFNHRLNRQLSPAEKGIDEALEQLRRITRPGSNLFLISDFQGFSESGLKHLYLLSKHNDITAVRVYDPLEEELPPPGYYAITNGAERMTLNAADQELRQGYLNSFRERSAALEKMLLPLGIPLLPLATTVSPRHYFREILGSRR
jgi:uncharacterized protein (DUF58 family)